MHGLCVPQINDGCHCACNEGSSLSLSLSNEFSEASERCG